MLLPSSVAEVEIVVEAYTRQHRHHLYNLVYHNNGNDDDDDDDNDDDDENDVCML